MALDNKLVKEILLSGKYVSAEDLKKAEDYAEKQSVPITDYLYTEGLLSRDLLGQAFAEHYKVPYADLNSRIPSREEVMKIPEEIAKKFRVVLFMEDEGSVTVATDDPSQKDLIVQLQNGFPNRKISLSYSLPEDIDSTFVHYRKPLKTRFTEILEQRGKVALEIIEEIIQDALAYKASDIHFEPQEKEVVVRFRIDGVLQEAGRIPKQHYENILNRIKVQSHLRIDEHFATQDGAMRYKKDNLRVDLRISLAPTLDGEKITIRVLAQYVKGLTLADLGLSAKDQKSLDDAARKPFGMILVTGPTGSGKTTTLYSVLRILNQPGVNITTIEDPVEFKITGVNQIQVNKETELTFATGLRSIVRQDPDIILVGEIRDMETSEIAVNAALTGHLLLSTFHANDAATSIPRLLDMGIEPFLLSSTLEIIIAQRLARKICETCRYSYTATHEDIFDILPTSKKWFPESKITLYKGKGCDRCGGNGYKGRTGIFEVITNTREMQDLILTNPSTKQIWELAQKQGSLSLFEDGLDKVREGTTTIEELLRVASPPREDLDTTKPTSAKADGKKSR